MLKAFAQLLILAGIFAIGVNVGNGRITIGSGGKYKKSVQKDLPANLNYLSTEEIYDQLREGFDGELDAQKLEDGLKAGLVKAAGDPFTEYLNAEEAKQFDNQLNGSFDGIGAELSKDQDSLIITTPIAGSPAEKSGLMARDVIAEIDGKSAYDITVGEAVKKIRGPKGSKVTLKVIRGDQTITVEITRDTIVIPSVNSEIIEGNIGLLKIIRFDKNTAALARTAAENFKSSNVRGVILDMRNNPGGTLDASVDVSSLWLKDKTVLDEKRSSVNVKNFKSRGTPTLLGIPTIILINGGSASASEIVAGALHDNGAAKIFGVKSFGKGSVQEARPLKNGAILKVTVVHWFTPNGTSIDKEGIQPDQKVERSEEDFKAGRDPQQQAAIDFLKK